MTAKDIEGEMRSWVNMIAVILGAPNATVQGMFRVLVDRRGRPFA
jgi:hypothetical protein